MKTFSLNDRFEKSPEMPFRVIEDEVVLVPVKRSVSDFHDDGIYLLRDKMSFRIWELLDGIKTVSGIQKTLLKEFQVDPSQLEKDREEFLQTLEKIGGIRRL